MNIHKYSLSRFCWIIVITLLFSPSAFAQNVEFSKENFPDRTKELKVARKNLKKGNASFDLGTLGSFNTALQYYLEANHFNPQNAGLNFRMGVCYLWSYDKSPALSYLEKAQRLDSTASKKIQLYLSMAYQQQSQYKEALACLTKYRNSLDARTAAEEGAMLDKRFKECESGLKLSAKPNIVTFDQLAANINSSFDEYCPVVDSKESLMAFTSRRKSSVGGKVNPHDGLYYEDIYFTYKNTSNVWDYPENPGAPLNGKANDATVALSADGQVLTLYKNIGGEDYICESTKTEGKWSKPKILDPEINRAYYHQPSATYSSDRKNIIFVSNIKGGTGGSDLYISQLNEDGSWSDAKNLGAPLNSSYDEEAPFLLNDSILYFSSNGFNSIGGYDVFISRKKNDGTWGEPVNMGVPLNSPGDDIYFVVTSQGEYYLSSDRINGYGGFDIYHVKLNMSSEEFLSKINPVFIHGSIIDETTREGVPAMIDIHDTTQANIVPGGASDSLGGFVASLTSMHTYEMLIRPMACDSVTFPKNLITGTAYHPEYMLSIKDSLTRTVLNGRLCDFKTGKALQFPIEVTDLSNNVVAARCMPDSAGLFHFELPSSASYKLDVYTSSCTHKPVSSLLPNNYVTSLVDGMNVKLENVYFDFDRSDIRADAMEVLNRHALLFKRFSNWQIIVSGNTDNMGSEEYNLYLSRRRAQTVADFLISKGVKKKQIKVLWYGFNQPVSSNQTEEGRQWNRRCEFAVFKY